MDSRTYHALKEQEERMLQHFERCAGAYRLAAERAGQTSDERGQAINLACVDAFSENLASSSWARVSLTCPSADHLENKVWRSPRVPARVG
jgi:hypothetical protein